MITSNEDCVTLLQGNAGMFLRFKRCGAANLPQKISMQHCGLCDESCPGICAHRGTFRIFCDYMDAFSIARPSAVLNMFSLMIRSDVAHRKWELETTLVKSMTLLESGFRSAQLNRTDIRIFHQIVSPETQSWAMNTSLNQERDPMDNFEDFFVLRLVNFIFCHCLLNCSCLLTWRSQRIGGNVRNYLRNDDCCLPQTWSYGSANGTIWIQRVLSWCMYVEL